MRLNDWGERLKIIFRSKQLNSEKFLQLIKSQVSVFFCKKNCFWSKVVY